MTAFVHIADERNVAAIRRNGLKLPRVPVSVGLDRPFGVFALPVVRDFLVSHQWLRELKRRGFKVAVGVYFRISDPQEVWAGKFNEERRACTLCKRQLTSRRSELWATRSSFLGLWLRTSSTLFAHCRKRLAGGTSQGRTSVASSAVASTASVVRSSHVEYKGAMRKVRSNHSIERTIVIAVLFLAAAAASAPSEITPTSDPGGDCVAARIVTERTARNRKYDEMYCAVNEDLPAYANCLRNVALKRTISFFTDRCNAPHEGAYVSFNGETHQVWRQPQTPHPDVTYAGTWKGDDLIVRVLPRKLIERFDEGGATYEVDVFIASGDSATEVHGTYDSRP